MGVNPSLKYAWKVVVHITEYVEEIFIDLRFCEIFVQRIAGQNWANNKRGLGLFISQSLPVN